MNLNVPKPESGLLGEAFGIAPDRQDEISAYLDSITNILYPGLNEGKLGKVYLGEILKKVAARCDTPEELLYATFNHLRWMNRHGIRLFL